MFAPGSTVYSLKMIVGAASLARANYEKENDCTYIPESTYHQSCCAAVQKESSPPKTRRLVVCSAFGFSAFRSMVDDVCGRYFFQLFRQVRL